MFQSLQQVFASICAATYCYLLEAKKNDKRVAQKVQNTIKLVPKQNIEPLECKKL